VIGEPRARKVTGTLYQQTAQPEAFFGHIFGEDTGFLVTFTGQQARLRRPDAPANELEDTRQRYWRYPDEAERAAAYLLGETQRRRDAYLGTHLFREHGNRRAANAVPTVNALWLDEDDGRYPTDGPPPTAIIHSSAERRHLYWRLTQPIAIEAAVALNRRIAFWAGGDTGKAGAASVLRVPGTQNFKRYPQVDPISMEIASALSWEPEVLEQAIPPCEVSGPAPRETTEPYDGPEINLEPYLRRVELIGESPDALGVKYAIVCPWVHEHSGGSRSGTYIGQRIGGGLWFYCNHDHCRGRGWREFKRAVFWNRRFTAKPTTGYTGPAITVEVRYE
jgi:hypothetical protein